MLCEDQENSEQNWLTLIYDIIFLTIFVKD